MRSYFKSRFFLHSLLAFVALPMLAWALSGAPMRSALKESLSILTLVAFFLMMGLFYWSRTGRPAARELKMGKIVRLHKWMGYTGVSLLLLHPIFLVVPRYFESGVAPLDALITILTTPNQGVILGILAWCLMLIIGLTARVRKRLPLKYTTWRTLHGLMAVVFIVIAACHVIDLGRHATMTLSLLIFFMTVGGVLMWISNYDFAFTRFLNERKQR